MALDLGTLVAKVRVDDDDFDTKTSNWSSKGAAVASTFGNLAADAIGQASSMLVDFVGDAAAASDATDKFKKTLEFAGLDTSKIEQLTASTQAYADATVYSLGDIQQITASLASNGVKDYDRLAESLGNLNSVAGGSPETYARLGQALTQTAGAGKLTTENWNQVTDAISGAAGPLQDALLQAGAYTGNFREAMERGEITAEEFNAAIMELGTDPIAVEAARSTETFEGAAGNLAATIQGKLTEALNLVKGPITDFQNGVAWFIQNIGQFTPLLAGLGAVILAALAPSIWAAVTATWAWTAALLANPITWIVLAIGGLVAAVVWLVMNWDTAVAWISEVWGGFITWITGVIEGFVGWWNGIWEAVGQWISDVWSGFTSWVQSVWDGFVNWIMSMLIGYVSFWIGVWTSVGQFVTNVWNGFVAFIQGVWQGAVNWLMAGLSGFLSFWNSIWSNVGNFLRDTWNGAMAFLQGIPQAILGVFSGAATWLYNIGRDIVNGLWNGLKSIWQSVSSWFEDTFGGIIDTVAGIFGIASPSRVFRSFGIYIGQGLIDGLDRVQPEVDKRFAEMERVPTTGGFRSGTRTGDEGGGNTYNKTVVYNAAEGQSLSDEEALFLALGSPRVKD